MRAQLVLVIVALTVGCVDKGAGGEQGKRIDPAYIEANLLDAPPEQMATSIGARFGGGAVIYLGVDVEQTRIAPGDKVSLVHYWQVVEPPGAAWRVFSHLRGQGGDFLNADLTDMRTGHPPSAWLAGQIIRDEQSFMVAKDWKSPTATLVVGLYQKGKHRIEDRMEVTGGQVGDDRTLAVVHLEVDLSKAPPPPGTLAIKKASAPIVIDGKADDPAWRAAAIQTSFTTAEGCPEMDDATSAKLIWDDQFLYVFVSSEDADVWSPHRKQDDSLWQYDVAEIFIDADGNRRGYVELQVSPNNVHFDTWLAVGKSPRDDSYDSGMQSQVVVRGTVDNDTDGDVGWDVEIAIPLAAVKGKDPSMKVAVPPRIGDTWRLNVVRANVTRNKKVTAASWNRIPCEDFHAVDRMLNVQFADAAGEVKPPAVVPPALPPEVPAVTPPGTAPAVVPAPVQRVDQQRAAPPTKPSQPVPAPNPSFDSPGQEPGVAQD